MGGLVFFCEKCYTTRMKNVSFVNFRDMGGLETPYGVVKSGMLYRAQAFLPKNKRDEAFLTGLGLDAVVDFRTVAEIREKPDFLPEGVEYVHSPVFPEESNPIAPTKKVVKEMMYSMSPKELDSFRDLVTEQYRLMPFSQSYAEVFRLMDEGKTLAFHCAAGKDRTGICAFLIELAFGRTLEQCKEEYLLTNLLREKENKRTLALLALVGVKKNTRAFILEMLECSEMLFFTAVNSIKAKYDTMDEFLEKEHGVTKERREQWIRQYIL